MMRVPDGWFDYSRFGSPIDSTRIVAIKTPLKKQFNTGRPASLSGDYTKILRGVPIEEEFTPEQMLQQFEERGWDVGLVIDLTFTNRYYEPQEFIARGVRHLKIKCPGQVIPPDDVYQQLCAGITEFLSDNSNGNGLVAVHCTHGLNRTGYLVCRYLMEKCGYSAEKAIKAFNKGRGNDIERENYLEHLRKGCPEEETKPHSPKGPTSPPKRSKIISDHSYIQRSLKSPPERNSGADSRNRLPHVDSDYQQHRDMYGDGAALHPDCRVNDGRFGGEKEGRGRYGKKIEECDLRTKLNRKARVEEGGRRGDDQRSGVKERGSRKRAHHMEDTYGEDAEYQDDSSLCHLQKRPALHMGGKRDDDQRSGVKEKGSRKRAHHMEDTYGEDAEYQDYSSLGHLQKRPALHMGGKRDDDQRSGVKERGSRKRAHHMEDTYGEDAEYQDYSSLGHLQKRPALHMQHPHYYSEGATPVYDMPNYPSRVDMWTQPSHYARTHYSRERERGSGMRDGGRRREGKRERPARW